MRLRPALLLAALTAFQFSVSASVASAQEPDAQARPKIIKWIDENGIVHYTTDPKRVPEALRRKAKQLRSQSPALERSRIEARAPTDPHDAWVTRNRVASPRADVWDEGVYEGEGAIAAVEPITPEERAAIEAERGEIEQRIAALEIEVGADEDLLKALISDPAVLPIDRAEDGELRAVAERLPDRLAELRTLRDRRDQLETP